jgi:hypothetical protein
MGRNAHVWCGSVPFSKDRRYSTGRHPGKTCQPRRGTTGSQRARPQARGGPAGLAWSAWRHTGTGRAVEPLARRARGTSHAAGPAAATPAWLTYWRWLLKKSSAPSKPLPRKPSRSASVSVNLSVGTFVPGWTEAFKPGRVLPPVRAPGAHIAERPRTTEPIVAGRTRRSTETTCAAPPPIQSHQGAHFSTGRKQRASSRCVGRIPPTGGTRRSGGGPRWLVGALAEGV